MIEQKLTDNWSIQISNLFSRKIEEDGDLVFTMKGKTVRLAIWTLKDKTWEQLYNDHQRLHETRNQDLTPILESFDLSDSKVARIGYMIEESDNQKRYKVMHGSSMVDCEVVEAAFYFDKDIDKEWALETWLTIKIE